MTSTMISKVELLPVATVLYYNHDCRHQDDMKKIGWIHPFLHIILEQNSYSAAKNWISSFPQNSSDDLCLLFCINPSSLSVKWRAGNVRVCVCGCVCGCVCVCVWRGIMHATAWERGRGDTHSPHFCQVNSIDQHFHTCVSPSAHCEEKKIYLFFVV